MAYLSLRSRLWIALLGLVLFGSIPGCQCSGPEPKPPPTEAPKKQRVEPDPILEDEDDLFERPTSLNLSRDLAPAMRSRLKDLERDYFESRFDFVIPSAERLLSMVGDDPRMKLRLYYLLARSHARNRNPTQAQHYEKLFRELFVEHRGKAPKTHQQSPKIHKLLEASETEFDKVHPNWNLDGDGEIWANVLVWRRLDREGPQAVVTMDHPGGGTIHASQSGVNLEAYLEGLGLSDDDGSLSRDQRFGFYYKIVSR